MTQILCPMCGHLDPVARNAAIVEAKRIEPSATQRQVAAMLGVNQALVSRVLAGKRPQESGNGWGGKRVNAGRKPA